jgi:hypothetical protein
MSLLKVLAVATFIIHTLIAGISAQASKTSKLTIKLVYEDSGLPVRNAEVMLFGIDGTGAGYPRARKGPGGLFTFPGVHKGKYLVNIFSNDIPSIHTIMLSQGISDISELLSNTKIPLKPIIVDGQSDQNLVIKTRRGGVIKGRVALENGSSTGRFVVSLYKKYGNEWGIFLSHPGHAIVYPGYNVLTDNRGYYTIPGLPEGEYLVGASRPTTDIRDLDDRSDRPIIESLSMDVTYFPGSKRREGSVPVKVFMGKAVSNINIKWIDSKLFRVSGRIISKLDGRPFSEAQIVLRSRKDVEANLPSFNQLLTESGPSGEWAFSGLPAGEYQINTSPSISSDLFESKQYRRSFVPSTEIIKIDNSNLSDYEIKVMQTGSIYGKFVTEDGTALPERLFFSIESTDGSQVNNGQASSPDKDGSFYLNNIIGKNLRVKAFTSISTDPDVEVSRIFLNLTDIVNRIDVEEGQEIGPLKIVLKITPKKR